LPTNSKPPSWFTKEQLQNAKVNHQRTLKNPQETYQTAPKRQTELPTNSKPPSWFTKEQLQNAEVIQLQTAEERTIREQLQNAKEKYRRSLPENDSKTLKRTKENRTPKRTAREDRRKLLKKKFQRKLFDVLELLSGRTTKEQLQNVKEKQLQIVEDNYKKYK
ncbi:13209_t:CDS:2, partial [Dentiscutata heterogama]